MNILFAFSMNPDLFTGVLLVWSILAVLSFLYVTWHLWRSKQGEVVLKIASAFLILFTGVVGLIIFLHWGKGAQYLTQKKDERTPFQQLICKFIVAIGGTLLPIWVIAWYFHCFMQSTTLGTQFVVQYVISFIVGYFIFQAFFEKKGRGGYSKALNFCLLRQLYVTNIVMAGVIPAVLTWIIHDPNVEGGWLNLHFWGMISLASLFACLISYPFYMWFLRKDVKSASDRMYPPVRGTTALVTSFVYLLLSLFLSCKIFHFYY